MTNMIDVLSVIWSLPGGGVSHYLGSINKLKQYESLNISQVLIRMPTWQVHQRLFREIQPIEILIRNRADFTWLPKLLKILRERRSSILMVHDFSGFIIGGLCRLCGVRLPILATHHVPYIPASLSRRLKGNLINKYSIYFLRKLANRVITVSERYRRELIHSGVNPNKIVTVHNGIHSKIDLNQKPEDLLRKEGFDSDSILIGTTSRLHPQKGLQFLIEAIPAILRKYPKVHLVLFGSGPLKTQLENLSFSLGVSNHVHFLGFRENIYMWISGLDIFLLPSLAEGHSISLLEAMRAALPIICTPVGDNLQTIRPHQDGIIVPPENSKALADAIIELIDNPELRHSIGQSAKQRFEEQFTETHMLDATFKVVNDVLFESI